MHDDKEKLANYIQENKVDVDLALDAFPKNSSLKQLFSNKKFIFLGEPDHWINEKYNFRLKIIDYLLDNGLSHIGMELGYSDGIRYNQYLKTGKPEDIKKLALYGYPVPQQGADGFSGTLIDSQKENTAFRANTYIQAEMKHAELLYTLLKSKSKAIKYFGFDVDTVAGGAYEDIIKLDNSEAFTQKMITIQKSPINDAILELKKLLVACDTQTQRDQEKELTLKALYESLTFASVAFFNPQPEILTQAFKKRERLMFRLFDYQLQNSKIDDKFVLMGHNMHLTKDHQAMKFGTDDNMTELWPTIGDYVYKKFPAQTLSIWMLFNQGEHSAPSVFPEKIISKTDAIESFFSKFGESFFLPIGPKAPVFGTEQKYICHNGEYVTGKLSNATDLIYFKNNVSKIS